MALRCGEQSVTADGPNGQRVFLRLWCKRWDCENCGPRKKAKFLARASRGEPTTFLTLTVNPSESESRNEAFHRASTAIPLLIKRLRRAFPAYRVEYCLVWETTKKGWPHCHALLRAPFIPKALISRAWFELTGAYVVDIRRIRSQREVVRYLGKYLAKSLEVPPGSRRWRTSRLYASKDIHKSLPPWLEGLRFRFSTEHVDRLALIASAEAFSHVLLEGYIHVLYPT